MRKRELLELLSEYTDDDIIALAIRCGEGEHYSSAIDHVIKGKGIALLASSKYDTYRMVFNDEQRGISDRKRDA